MVTDKLRQVVFALFLIVHIYYVNICIYIILLSFLMHAYIGVSYVHSCIIALHVLKKNSFTVHIYFGIHVHGLGSWSLEVCS